MSDGDAPRPDERLQKIGQPTRVRDRAVGKNADESGHHDGSNHSAPQLQLDHQPQLAQSPHEILSALEIRPGSSVQLADTVCNTYISTTTESIAYSCAS